MPPVVRERHRRPDAREGGSARFALRWADPSWAPAGLCGHRARVPPAPRRRGRRTSTSRRAFLYQDPYSNACTAAATMMMLNTIAYRGPAATASSGPRPGESRRIPATSATCSRSWPSRVRTTRSGRRRTAQIRTAGGTSLNAFGWGEEAMTDPAKRVYDDREYRTLRRRGRVRRQVDRAAVDAGRHPGLGRWPRAGDDGVCGHRRGSRPCPTTSRCRLRLPERPAAPGTPPSTAGSASRSSARARSGRGSRPTARRTARTTIRGRPGRSGARSRPAAGRPSGTTAG